MLYLGAGVKNSELVVEGIGAVGLCTSALALEFAAGVKNSELVVVDIGALVYALVH